MLCVQVTFRENAIPAPTRVRAGRSSAIDVFRRETSLRRIGTSERRHPRVPEAERSDLPGGCAFTMRPARPRSPIPVRLPVIPPGYDTSPGRLFRAEAARPANASGGEADPGTRLFAYWQRAAFTAP
jgi:hypothetical protein